MAGEGVCDECYLAVTSGYCFDCGVWVCADCWTTHAAEDKQREYDDDDWDNEWDPNDDDEWGPLERQQSYRLAEWNANVLAYNMAVRSRRPSGMAGEGRRGWRLVITFLSWWFPALLVYGLCNLLPWAWIHSTMPELLMSTTFVAACMTMWPRMRRWISERSGGDGA